MEQAAQFAANAIAEQLNAWKFATADGDQLLSARFGAATTLLRRRLLRLALAARTAITIGRTLFFARVKKQRAC